MCVYVYVGECVCVRGSVCRVCARVYEIATVEGS